MSRISESDRNRSLGKRRYCCNGVLKVIDNGIAVTGLIHSRELRISVQHRLLGFYPVIFNQFTGYPDPLSVLERADLDLRIGLDLLCDILSLAGLYIKLSFKNVNRSKGPYSRLVALNSRKIIDSRLLKKIIDSVHGSSSSVSSLL